MNFALSSILIITLLFPGAVCIYSYFTAFFSKEKDIAIPILDSLILGLFFSVILHCSFICIIEWSGYRVNLDFLYSVISGKDTKDFVSYDGQFIKYTKQFIFYMISIMLTAFFAGKAVKKLVFFYRLDRKAAGLVNYNYWYSIFSLKFIPQEVDLIYIDVMVPGNLLYSGILYDFEYSPKTDSLEMLVLKGATRRKIDEEGRVGDAIDIPSDMFIIKATEMMNINVRYISLAEAGEEVIETEIEPGL